ncbi:hypothetical protein [Peptoniphilus asaccharolyticus]
MKVFIVYTEGQKGPEKVGICENMYEALRAKRMFKSMNPLKPVWIKVEYDKEVK